MQDRPALGCEILRPWMLHDVMGPTPTRYPYMIPYLPTPKEPKPAKIVPGLQDASAVMR